MADDQSEFQTLSVPFGARITIEFPDDGDGEDPHLRSLSWIAGPVERVQVDRP